ncbi:MAG: linear amide C-N hydrolase [Bacteroidales bacterium]|nr:linear amide C-N hydrolase [Bacteroidales bacterium]
MKKAIKIILIVLISIILALAVIVWCLWGGEIRTLASLKQVDGNPYLYAMEYKASYDLDEIIERDVDQNAELLNYVTAKIGKGIPIKGKSAQVADENGKLETFNCTSFQVKNATGKGFLYGRNYDYFANPTLVTISRPKNGYASMAASDMSHFGYNLESLPTSFTKKLMCLAAIYAPVDGINEKGLCTSIMALPHQPANQNSGKHSVGTSIIMRLWLDRCATVDEALNLLATVDLRHDSIVGSGYHYMVADASGDCAIIEFDKEDGWKTLVLRKPSDQQYMLVTNHLLSPKYRTDTPDPAVGNPNSKSWWRYETADNYLKGLGGVLTPDQAQECLNMVHWDHLVLPNGKVEVTQHSNIYDQQMLSLRLRMWNELDKSHFFQL